MAGMIPPETIEDIKSRVSIREVVARSVQLKRKGNDWWGCCPFHHEKSASFHVKEDKGFYHCFGCGAHGNAFDFVKETRGGNFVDAVEYLAEMTGVQIKREEANPAEEKFRATGLMALEKSQEFFRSNLVGDQKAYFERRGLSDETIEAFGLGYAPDEWGALKNVLAENKVSRKVMQETGMTIPSDKGDYDRFRGRVMFPIHNLKGEVISFGGRILGEGEPKYLNGPETPFFNKRYNLYNLNRAREFIRKENQALIVEGYMDAVALWQFGIKTAVAPLGTAITEDQVKLLWRYHDKPVVCMDGDNAGRKAAARIAQKIMPELTPGKSLNFMLMPDGEDPDTFVQSKGRAAFKELVASALSLDEIVWMSLSEGKDLKNADDRSSIEAEINTLTEEIADQTIKTNYRKVLRDRLWNANRKPKFVRENQKPLSKKAEKARILLSILFRKPEMMERVYEKLSDVEFENQQDKELQSVLFRLFVGEGVAKEDLDAYLVNIGILERVRKTYQSSLVTMKADAELEPYWWECHADWKREQSKREGKKVAASFSNNPSEEMWDKLKEMHKGRLKKRT